VSQLSPRSEDHKRYSTQARWTATIREQLLTHAGLDESSLVLVITAELSDRYHCQSIGVDIDPQATRFAATHDNASAYTIGDAYTLPFPDSCFDIVLCHFLLLWLEYPRQALRQMMRVTKPRGWVLALAEPDYGGRIDHPIELARIGKLQQEALAAQGCDTQIGRKIRELFNQAGLLEVHAGVLGGEWTGQPSKAEMESEWVTLASDLAEILTEDEIDSLQRSDHVAWGSGSRILYVPTFYAIGRVA
jgi:SAM-dependent methyltransferase